MRLATVTAFSDNLQHLARPNCFEIRSHDVNILYWGAKSVASMRIFLAHIRNIWMRVVSISRRIAMFLSVYYHISQK